MPKSSPGAVICPMCPPPSHPGSLGLCEVLRLNPFPDKRAAGWGCLCPAADSPEIPSESFRTPSSEGDFFFPP